MVNTLELQKREPYGIQQTEPFKEEEDESMTGLSVEESVEDNLDRNMCLSPTNLSLSNLSLSNSDSYGDISSGISMDCHTDTDNETSGLSDTSLSPRHSSQSAQIIEDEYWSNWHTDDKYQNYSSAQQRRRRRRRRNIQRSQSAPLNFKSKKRRLYSSTDSLKTLSLVESSKKKHQRLNSNKGTILPPIPPSLCQFSDSNSKQSTENTSPIPQISSSNTNDEDDDFEILQLYRQCPRSFHYINKHSNSSSSLRQLTKSKSLPNISETASFLDSPPPPSSPHQNSLLESSITKLHQIRNYKALWDQCTFVLTLISVYHTHIAIRDRRFEFNTFTILCQIWFTLDLLSNFFFLPVVDNEEEHGECGGEDRTYSITDGKITTRSLSSSNKSPTTLTASYYRYVTTWFLVDLICLYPWEWKVLKPIVEKQKKRKFFVKFFFRSKAVIKVTRILKGRHFVAFGKVANNTKRIGYGSKKLLSVIIKYLPKYLLFWRNMKTVLLFKAIRQIHFLKKIIKGTGGGESSQKSLVSSQIMALTNSTTSTKSKDSADSSNSDSFHLS